MYVKYKGMFTEYIVSFNGYYKPQARKRFLTAALHDSGVLSWKIIPRDNLAYDYPSDFDVVKVEINSHLLVHQNVDKTKLVPIDTRYHTIFILNKWLFLFSQFLTYH